MCSGKTTLANMIMEKYPNYKKYSFGQKVKDVAVDLFDMKGKDRSLLVKIGGYMRDINPDVWVDYLMKQIMNVDDCIIDDIRYQNEVDACIKNGFTFIKLSIPKDIQIERIKRVYPDNYEDHIENINHNSETNELIIDKCIEIDTSKILKEKLNNIVLVFMEKGVRQQ
tara:strand:+ start:307 stop:810 length:504 start_codon:yes stop_codon:yes gene_type:complete